MVSGADDDAVVGFIERLDKGRISSRTCADIGPRITLPVGRHAVNGHGCMANKPELLAFSAPAQHRGADGGGPLTRRSRSD